MNQIFRLSGGGGGQPAVKFNLSDVISTRVGQSGNCLFLTLLTLVYLIGSPLLGNFGCVWFFSSACLKCHITSVLHLLPPQTQCENKSPVNFL